MTAPHIPEEQSLSESIRMLASTVEKCSRTLAGWLRPRVVADLYPRWSVNMLYFRLRNVGPVPAYGVRVSLEPPAMIRGKMSSDLNLFQQSIGVLSPNQEVSFFFATALDLFKEADATHSYAVTIEYHAPDGESFSDTLSMSTDILRGLPIELPATDRVLDRLDAIQKELEIIAGYARHLRDDELRKAYDRSQAEQLAKPQLEEDFQVPSEPAP